MEPSIVESNSKKGINLMTMITKKPAKMNRAEVHNINPALR